MPASWTASTPDVQMIAPKTRPTTPTVTSVSVVHELRPDPRDARLRTAIDKRPVPGAVRVQPLGLDGDTQCDRKNHGGPYQAVYVYADEDARRWADELGREIPPGLFGENLRTAGVDVTGAEIGERWQIGGTLLVEVTAPRIPCHKFADRMAEPHWVRRFTEGGLPGAYLRVLRPGSVQAGDPVAVAGRPGHGITIGEVFLRARPRTMTRLLDWSDRTGLELSPSLRHRAEQAAARS